MLTQDQAFTDAMTYLAGALPSPNNGTYRDFLGAVTAAKQHGWSESQTATWAESTARGKAEYTWQTLKSAKPGSNPVNSAVGLAKKYGYNPPMSGAECAACGNRSHHLTGDGLCYRCAPPPVQTDRICLGCGQIDVSLRASLCQDCHDRIAGAPTQPVAPLPPPEPERPEPERPEIGAPRYQPYDEWAQRNSRAVKELTAAKGPPPWADRLAPLVEMTR